MRAVAVVVVGLLFIGRRPSSLFQPQLWAEDGEVFYEQELLHGLARSIFEPYAGYLNVVPRLTSAIAAHVPAIAVPFVFALISLCIAIWACSLFSSQAYRPIVASDALRFFLCCAIATIPSAHELVGILTNVHWYLALLIFFILIRPAGLESVPLRAYAPGVAITLLAVLSAPETILFVPLAAWKWWRGKSLLERLIPSVFFVTLFIQLVTLVFQPAAASVVKTTIDGVFFSTMTAFVYRVLIASTVGQPLSELLSARNGQGLALLVGIGFTIVATLVVDRVRSVRAQFGCLIALSLAFIAVSLYARGLTGAFVSFGNISFDAERYFFLPTVFFILAVAISIESVFREETVAKLACFCIFFVAGAVMNYDAGRLPDMNWASYSPRIDRWIIAERQNKRSAELVVPINPPGWLVGLPARK